jgi:Protein of unknown function (DUF2793)
MANTSLLGLPLLAADQAQKHVTMNTSLTALDDLVHLKVIDRTRTSPPGSPAEGDGHIIAAGPTGAWSGKAQQIAVWHGGAWVFYVPREGWRSWITDEGITAVFVGAAWSGGATFSNFTWSDSTIAAGVLTVMSSAVVVYPESGATDDVTDIVGGTSGTLVIISGTNGKTINFIDGGNLKLGGASRTLSNFDDTLGLIRRGTDWLEISYSDNG